MVLFSLSNKVNILYVADNSKPLNQTLQALSHAMRLDSTPGPPSRENSQIKVYTINYQDTVNIQAKCSTQKSKMQYTQNLSKSRFCTLKAGCSTIKKNKTLEPVFYSNLRKLS